MAKKMTAASKKLNDAIDLLIKKGKGRGEIIQALVAQGFGEKRATSRTTSRLYKVRHNKTATATNVTAQPKMVGPKAAKVEHTLRTVRRILEADFLTLEKRVQMAIEELPKDGPDHGN